VEFSHAGDMLATSSLDGGTVKASLCCLTLSHHHCVVTQPTACQRATCRH
jgi:hypothetical protein